MKTENAVVDKSMEFAVWIVTLSRYLREEEREYELASQLLRSGTSIGANVHEAVYGQSRKDFLSKMSIALKEASETIYWLELLRRAGVLSDNECASIVGQAEELRRLLTPIVKSTKERSNS